MTLARRRSLAVLFASLFLAALSFVGAQPAFAAGCYDGTCKGLPISSTNYSGVPCTTNARQLTEFSEPGHRIQLMYSPTCNSAWVRLTTRSGAAPTACNTTWGQIATYTPQRTFAYATGAQADCRAGYSVVSRMSPFGNVLVRACINYVWGSSQPNGGLTSPCTTYY